MLRIFDKQKVRNQSTFFETNQRTMSLMFMNLCHFDKINRKFTILWDFTSLNYLKIQNNFLENFVINCAGAVLRKL